MSEINAISLSQLAQYVQQVLELNFEDALWVEAELSSVKESRGHIYVELVEQDNAIIVAKQRATIWRTQIEILRDTYDDLFDQIMTDGQQVRLLVKITFHAVFGFSLNIINIDPTYTMGLLAQQKQITIDKLIAEGIHEKNKALHVPAVIQNVAVLTSRTAAGYADFINQLNHTTPNLGFHIDLYSCAMQGRAVSHDVKHALNVIKQGDRDYDIICILRGGGSKLDLAAFDEEDLARAILDAPYPVWSGIGHEIDFSIVDFCAHSYFKTPTALAAAIINYNLDFIHLLNTIEDEIYRKNVEVLALEKQNLDRSAQHISFGIQQKTAQAKNKLHQKELTLSHDISKRLTKEKNRLDQLHLKLEANDINHVLKRGFTLIEQNKEIIKEAINFEEKKSFNIIWKTEKKSISI